MESGPQDKAAMGCGFGFWNTLLQFPVPQQRFHCPRNISKRCCVCAYTRWNPVSLAKLCKQAEEFNHAEWNPLKSYCGQTELNANCRELFSDMFAPLFVLCITACFYYITTDCFCYIALSSWWLRALHCLLLVDKYQHHCSLLLQLNKGLFFPIGLLDEYPWE